MYEALVEACDEAEAHGTCACSSYAARAARSRPAPTSRSFPTSLGDDGVAYERRLDRVIDRVERLPVPTIAEVDGVGGRRRLCDRVRVRPPHLLRAGRFGVPVARTLGNCLSMANTARLMDLVGPPRRGICY